MVLTKNNQHQTLFGNVKLVKTSPLGMPFTSNSPLPNSPGRITGEITGVCFRTRGEVFDNGAFYKMMSVEYNYQKSFCIKYLLKFKNHTKVCQTIALI